MKQYKCLIVIFLVVLMALPAFAQRKTAKKTADALLSSARIALGSNPPRFDEAMNLVNQVLEENGPVPEAYLHRGSIHSEYANKEYDLIKKIDQLNLMMVNFDSARISCENPNVKAKQKKDCKKYGDLIDSVKAYYWRDNYNNGVQMLNRLDQEYQPSVDNAADSVSKEAAQNAYLAAADSIRIYFRTAIAADPAAYRSYEGIGISFDRIKQYDSAATWFIKANQLAPDSINLIQNTAYAYIQMMDWSNGVIWFKKLIEKVPDDIGTITNIAACYNNMQMYDSAFAYNMNAVAADPKSPVAFIDVGQYYLIKARTYSDSVNLYQKDEKSPEAARYTKLRDDTFDSSLTYFKKGLEIDPENLIALENYGIVNMIRGNFSESEVMFKKLTEVEPDRKEHWLDLGDTYIQLQKFQEAMAPFEKAAELDPTDIRVWEILADLYGSNKMPEKAEQAKARAEELKNQ